MADYRIAIEAFGVAKRFRENLIQLRAVSAKREIIPAFVDELIAGAVLRFYHALKNAFDHFAFGELDKMRL